MIRTLTMRRMFSTYAIVSYMSFTGVTGGWGCAAPVFAQSLPALSVPASAGTKDAPAALLTVTPEAGLEPIEPGTVRFDFGVADPITTPKLQHLFTLRNDTKQPVTISKIKTSCGCESVAFSRNGKEQIRPEQKPAILAPGRAGADSTGGQRYGAADRHKTRLPVGVWPRSRRAADEHRNRGAFAA